MKTAAALAGCRYNAVSVSHSATLARTKSISRYSEVYNRSTSISRKRAHFTSRRRWVCLWHTSNSQTGKENGEGGSIKKSDSG